MTRPLFDEKGHRPTQPRPYLASALAAARPRFWPQRIVVRRWNGEASFVRWLVRLPWCDIQVDFPRFGRGPATTSLLRPPDNLPRHLPEDEWPPGFEEWKSR